VYRNSIIESQFTGESNNLRIEWLESIMFSK
jgi:hypothetical protein